MLCCPQAKDLQEHEQAKAEVHSQVARLQLQLGEATAMVAARDQELAQLTGAKVGEECCWKEGEGSTGGATQDVWRWKHLSPHTESLAYILNPQGCQPGMSGDKSQGKQVLQVETRV